MSKTQSLYRSAKGFIPGGTQLLSKRPELFAPDQWPAYYKKAKGCEVVDLDDKRYIDMSSMGIGACILGYADKDINKAVTAVVEAGSMTTLNAPEEVELARLLTQLHPWADMARFARSGGEAMAVAVRIARAATGRDMILFCGYHGWHDWYISSNLANNASLDGHLLPGLEPKGVPRALKGTSIPFSYNDKEGFLRSFKRYGNRIAAVVMEPLRNDYPDKGFLETIRKTTRRCGVPLVFDEITVGWRLCAGGAHKVLGIRPDMAVFAKAISNGFPMAAIIGTRQVMDSAQRSFISSTYWTDRIGPAAAIATINKMIRVDAASRVQSLGRNMQVGWKRLAKDEGVDIEVGGIYPLSHFSFKYARPLVPKTLFTQFMLKKGFLATTAFYPSYAHSDAHLEKYLEAAGQAFHFIARAIDSGSPEKYLKGPVCHSGFKRLN